MSISEVLQIRIFRDRDHFIPNPKHILIAYFLDIGSSIASFKKFGNQIRISRHIFQSKRQAIANTIIVRTNADMIDADQFHYVVDVICHARDVSIQFAMVFGKLVNDGLRGRIL